ncbi:MAG TPA: hypothetical protein V6D48_24180 [Oculatellaceae cyanobacterium]
MLETRRIETPKPQRKPLGMYLVEAGLVTSTQVETALNEQKQSGKRLGEILASHGWVEQQTIEYLMKKVVVPARETLREKLPEQYNTRNQNLIAFEQTNPSEPGNSESLPLSALPSRGFEVYFSPKKTFRFLLTVVLGLLLINLLTQTCRHFLPDYPLRDGIANVFYVDAEQNIPALYSASTLLFCSILLAIISHAKKVAGNRYFRYWGALSIIFMLFFWDELLSFHERLIDPLRSTFQASGIFYFTWVIPGAIFVGLVGVSFWRFLCALPAKTRLLFSVAAILYVGGTIGMELVGGYYANFYSQENMTYALISTIEEGLEMLGIAVFIYALLSYMSSYFKDEGFQVRFIDDRKQRVRV